MKKRRKIFPNIKKLYIMAENKSKVVNMNLSNTTEKKSQSLTFDQLKQVAAQLQRKNVELQKQLNAMNSVALRLQLLFKVVECKDAFNETFVTKCTDEIEGLLTIPEQEETESTEATETTETTETTTEATAEA